MLDKAKVMEIARTELEKHRGSADKYEATLETYRADVDQWIVWFDWKSEFPIPGGKNAVLVHKQTGEAVFLPGE